MDEATQKLAAQLVAGGYVQQGVQSIRSCEHRLASLLSQRCLPAHGWDDLTIQHTLSTLALMDSNNFAGSVGVGEREGRVFSSLVRQRHFGMAHGVGRSGDIGEVQPKAAGSSLLYKLTNCLALDAVKLAGFNKAKEALVLPLATGMSILLAVLALVGNEGKGKKVLWCRCDQKSCLKALVSAGLDVVVVEGKLKGDEVVTDTAAIQHHLSTGTVCAVVTTTSCFAPRAPDNVGEVARLCKEAGVVHVVNNAYGVQARKTMAAINQAHCQGRVDVAIQSTDKNFMVPVGGCVVVSGFKDNVARIAKSYPGRASAAPITDLFITLLCMGRDGFTRLLDTREAVFEQFKGRMDEVARGLGERVLTTPKNPISFVMSLASLGERGSLTLLGSMLYARHCTGARVVTCQDTKTVCGTVFEGYGSHHSNYPTPYLTMACAMGMEQPDIERFVKVLLASVQAFRKRVADKVGEEKEEGKEGKEGDKAE